MFCVSFYFFCFVLFLFPPHCLARCLLTCKIVSGSNNPTRPKNARVKWAGKTINTNQKQFSHLSYHWTQRGRWERARERRGDWVGEKRQGEGGGVKGINHIPLFKIPHNYCHPVAERVYLWQGRWQIAAALFTQLTVALCLFRRAQRFWFPVKKKKQRLREYLRLS